MNKSPHKRNVIMQAITPVSVVNSKVAVLWVVQESVYDANRVFHRLAVLSILQVSPQNVSQCISNLHIVACCATKLTISSQMLTHLQQLKASSIFAKVTM